MTQTYIAMLRAINVGGKTIRMAELKAVLEAMGLANVQTYVQSGNVIFRAAEQDETGLGGSITNHLEQAFGFAPTTLVRLPGYFEGVIERNPFTHGREEDPSKLHVTFLARAPGAQALAGLTLPAGESDEFWAGEREIYLFCPNGYGRTKLNNAFFEKKLATPATTRNWKTVNTLLELARKA